MSTTSTANRFIASRIASLPPSGIRRFFDLVAASKDIISLGVGEPDFVTPWHIREAGIYSLEQGRTTYTSNWGLLDLRKAIAAYLEDWQGLRYDPANQIVVTVGVAEGIDLVMRAVLEPGDEVLVPQPCFVSYTACVTLAGGTPVPVGLSADEDFKLTPQRLRTAITPRSKVLLLGFPGNPTGATMTREELAEIAQIAVEHDLLVVSDEIYGELTYEGQHVSIATLPGMTERTIFLGGFSKAFAMTGWRIGYACGPVPILEMMYKIHQYTIMCAPITGQLAALEALRHGQGQREMMRQEYDRRRRLVLRRLTEIGLPCFEPRGAFYAFPSIAHTGLTDEAFAVRLLQEEKVAVVPGGAFGVGGAGHIRMAYATGAEQLKEALDRIERFVRRLG